MTVRSSVIPGMTRCARSGISDQSGACSRAPLPVGRASFLLRALEPRRRYVTLVHSGGEKLKARPSKGPLPRRIGRDSRLQVGPDEATIPTCEPKVTRSEPEWIRHSGRAPGVSPATGE